MFINNMDLNQRDGFLCQEQTLNCKVSLQNKDLWQKFHTLETEMIITKSGRRMFPALRVQIEKLDPNAQYCVLIEMVPVSKCRYKYSSSGGWAPAGAEEAQSPNRIYLHPESPAPGHHWMSQAVSFSRLKLTNTTNPPPGQLVLSSMHRYQPRIIIVRASDPRHIAWAPHTSLSFLETQFIAVTAYQNDRITKLKIDNNPFAKGFRENGQSKCKRKRQQSEEDIVVDDVRSETKSTPEPLFSPRTDTDVSSDGPSSPEDSTSSPVRQASSQDQISYIVPSPEAGSTPKSHKASSPEGHPAPTFGAPQLYTYPSVYVDMYHPYYPTNFPIYPTNCLGVCSYYNPYSIPLFPQDLSVQKAQTTNVTDFSIKAIMGLS